jgi:hypothetical protein
LDILRGTVKYQAKINYVIDIYHTHSFVKHQKKLSRPIKKNVYTNNRFFYCEEPAISIKLSDFGPLNQIDGPLNK